MATAVVGEQPCAYVPQAGAAMAFPACGEQLAGSTTGAGAEKADASGVPQPFSSLTVVQTPTGMLVV
jgi:hypothetical protein